MLKTRPVAITILLVIIVAASMVLSSCSSQPATSTTVQPATSATIQPRIIKSNYHAAEAVITKELPMFGDAVTKATNGAITFQHNYMGALGGVNEQVTNLGAGLFDMAMLVVSYYQGVMPLHQIVYSTGFTSDPGVMAKAANDALALPQMQSELTKLNLKGLFFIGAPSNEYMGNKPVLKPDDFKGLKVRVTGSQATAMQLFGTTPVNIDTTETAAAIQKGTVDGAILPITTFNAMGIHSVCKYVTYFGLGAGAYLVAMNLNTWNKLEPQVQQIMLDLAKTIPGEHAKLWDAEIARVEATWAPLGMQVTKFSESDRAKVKSILVPAAWNAWLEKTKDIGGQQLLDSLQASVKKYEAAK